MESRKLCFVAGLCLFMVGCASNTKIGNTFSNYQYQNEKFGHVEISSANAISENAENSTAVDKLNLETYLTVALQEKGLYDESSKNKIQIKITDVNIRDNVSAILAGFLAGSDKVEGQITLIDGNGKEKLQFEVFASYALGGVAGQEETRLEWLAKEFSKLTTESIIGKQ